MNAPISTRPVPADIGGYRVVRQLAHDAHALTVLVHADGETRVARVFGAHCPLRVIDSEVAVLDAIGRSDPALRDHAAHLDDLLTLPDGRLALLFEQVGGPTLDDVLAMRRGNLELGEAVTVLAPLADALEAAHCMGLTGVSLHPAAIRFRPTGAPVIIRVKDAVTGPALPQRFRAAEPAYVADLEALVRLGSFVADAVLEPHRTALKAALSAALRSTVAGRSLTLALFDLAGAQPLRREVPADMDSVGGLLVRGNIADHASGSNDGGVNEPRGASTVRLDLGDGLQIADAVSIPPRLALVLDTLRELGMPPSVIEPVQASAQVLVARGAHLVSAVRRSPAAVRPRYLLAGGAGLAALALAVVVGVSPGAASLGSSDTVAEKFDAAPVGVETLSLETPSPETMLPETASHPAPDDWQGIVESLLDRWDRCRVAAPQGDVVAEPDTACRSQVVHLGSAAEHLISVDDPRHAVLSGWNSVPGEVVVVERMGGAVLIDLVVDGTTTASLFLVRSEAGWRVRDVIG